MFRWYNRSWICFAYLSDMDDLASSTTSLESLGDSRWFTRGWTLQELLAPKVVTFYNASWQLLGSKETLSPFLSSITGIDEAILIGKAPLRKVPVATRMSWASKRQTTRTEDSAYCLLGVFDINMPLLYGEGEKAFARLQSEILQETNDLSILAWTSTVTDPERREEYSGLLAKSPSDFLAGSKLDLFKNPRISEDFEVVVTRKTLSLKTILRGRADSEEEESIQRDKEYVLQLQHKFLDPRSSQSISTSKHSDMNAIEIGIVVSKTPSGFVRYKPWCLAAGIGRLKNPEIQKLNTYNYGQQANPLRLVRYLTSEAALDLGSTRLKNAIFVSIDDRILTGGSWVDFRAEPRALWDGLNRVFLDRVKQHSAFELSDARFLQFYAGSYGRILLATAIAGGSSSRPRECWAALLEYEKDEMCRWMIDKLEEGEWNESSDTYLAALTMLDWSKRRGEARIGNPWTSMPLCPSEYFATSTTPASRTVRLSDGTKQEITVSIIPHNAAEGACEVIVSLKKEPQLSPRTAQTPLSINKISPLSVIRPPRHAANLA